MVPFKMMYGPIEKEVLFFVQPSTVGKNTSIFPLRYKLAQGLGTRCRSSVESVKHQSLISKDDVISAAPFSDCLRNHWA